MSSHKHSTPLYKCVKVSTTFDITGVSDMRGGGQILFYCVWLAQTSASFHGCGTNLCLRVVLAIAGPATIPHIALKMCIACHVYCTTTPSVAYMILL